MSIQWLHGEVQRPCPVCREAGPKTLVLATDPVLPGWDRVTLVRCACGAAFLTELAVPDYATAGSHGSDYHVEQAFGFDPMAPVLLRLPAGSVRRCLDVGCAFGLMLDFARFTFGWEVVGVDPSGLAPEGAKALDLPIVHAYLSSALDLRREGGESREPFDLAICSEVLEHVADPHALLAAIGERLSPEGLLVLTTPNLDGVHAAAAPGDLVRALSPGLHLVLYDSTVLTRVLDAAGFAAVRIEASPTTLVAFAARSAHGLDSIAAACTDRSPLLRYFDARAESAPPTSALASSFAYRHFRDCVNAGDHAAAAVSRKRLAKLYGERFGIDLERPESATAQDRGSFNLPGAWYFSGILELNGHQRPEQAAACFAAAVAAAEAILARTPTAVLDGETEAVLLRSRALLPAALAGHDADRALRDLRALGEQAERGEIPREAFEEARQRVFIRLVHAGALGMAEPLAPSVAAQLDSAAPEGDRQDNVLELEARYCLAMLALQRGRAAEAAEGFGAVRRRLEQVGGEAAALLAGPARDHERLALQRAAPGRRAAPGLMIAERFVAAPARFAALRLPLDVIARQPAERLRLLVIAEEPALGERVATLRPQNLRPDEHLRLEFAPFAAPPGATFLLGVEALAAADAPRENARAGADRARLLRRGRLFSRTIARPLAAFRRARHLGVPRNAASGLAGPGGALDRPLLVRRARPLSERLGARFRAPRPPTGDRSGRPKRRDRELPRPARSSDALSRARARPPRRVCPLPGGSRRAPRVLARRDRRRLGRLHPRSAGRATPAAAAERGRHDRRVAHPPTFRGSRQRARRQNPAARRAVGGGARRPVAALQPMAPRKRDRSRHPSRTAGRRRRRLPWLKLDAGGKIDRCRVLRRDARARGGTLARRRRDQPRAQAGGPDLPPRSGGVAAARRAQRLLAVLRGGARRALWPGNRVRGARHGGGRGRDSAPRAGVAAAVPRHADPAGLRRRRDPGAEGRRRGARRRRLAAHRRGQPAPRPLLSGRRPGAHLEGRGKGESAVSLARISVIVPVYNGRRFLRAALDSVFGQSLPPYELIVVDDGSTDGSLDELTSLAPTGLPIRVLRQANRGQS